jgi:hypothetical protein
MKSSKSFATLVIQLPSDYEGGKSVVSYGGQTATFDFTKDPNATSDLFYVSFLDCQHQILPVTKGYRLCLVYNICPTAEILPNIAQEAAIIERLANAVKRWEAGEIEEKKLIYHFDTKYKKSQFSFEELKGKDLLVAKLLREVL